MDVLHCFVIKIRCAGGCRSRYHFEKLLSISFIKFTGEITNHDYNRKSLVFVHAWPSLITPCASPAVTG